MFDCRRVPAILVQKNGKNAVFNNWNMTSWWCRRIQERVIIAVSRTHHHRVEHKKVQNLQTPNKFSSSTAQGGGGSFKNRKPIGEVGCCESGMAERSHWWIERCLISLTLSLSLTIYLPTYLFSIYLSIYLSNDLSIYLSIDLSIYRSIYLSI